MKQLTRKGHSTRDRILNETLTLLQEQWYDGVSLREVAKRCEIKLGNLQYYLFNYRVPKLEPKDIGMVLF